MFLKALHYGCLSSYCNFTSTSGGGEKNLYLTYESVFGTTFLQIADSNDWKLAQEVLLISKIISKAPYISAVGGVYGYIALGKSTAVNFASGNQVFSLYIDDANSGDG